MDSYRENIYVVTCPARTGSGMLFHLLRSHPEICSHSEVFSPNGLAGLTGVYLNKSREQPGFLETLLRERERDPIKFLYKVVLNAQGKKAVGFKLKYDELVLPEYKALRDEIATNLDFRIIHLWRENLLRRFLSYHIANYVTHVTLAVEGQPIPEMPPVRLEPLECERDFETTLRRRAEFKELFARHRTFSLSYEEMVAWDQEKMAGLQTFLGVSPRELTTTTKRLGNDNLRSAIANFDELRSYFAGGPFSKFFENG